MTFTKKVLRKLIAEELQNFNPIEASKSIVNDASTAVDIKSEFIKWLGRKRALQLWFHGAHHVVSGETFSSDHVELYGKIYTELEASFDGDAEKAIGIAKDESVVCPIAVTQHACEIMRSYGSPVAMRHDMIAAVGLKMVEEHIKFLEELFVKLEDAKMLSLGLNDHLAAQANAFETYVYLLRQRVSR